MSSITVLADSCTKKNDRTDRRWFPRRTAKPSAWTRKALAAVEALRARPARRVLAVSAAVLGLAFASPAAAALSVTPITWDVVGLDHNRPLTSGPDLFPAGARVCSDVATTNVAVNFVWTDGNGSGWDFGSGHPYINSRPGSLTSLVFPAIGAGECVDAYFELQITRSASAFGQSRRYSIVATDSNGSASSPSPRQIYVEQIVSQNRNTTTQIRYGQLSDQSDWTTLGYGGSINLAINNTYFIELTTQTSTSYEELQSFLTLSNTIFQVLGVSTTYGVLTAPPSRVPVPNPSLWADGCLWDSNPASPTYNSCLSTGKAGGVVVTTYEIRIISGGGDSVSLNALIYDRSGSSFHYNTDFSTPQGEAVTFDPANSAFSKRFVPSTIGPGGTSRLRFTITNPNPVAISGYNFLDTLPAGVLVATPPNVSNTCGGTVTAVAGTGTIALAGGTVGAGGSCSVLVNVTAASAGTYNNVSGNLFIGDADTGNHATASLTVSSTPPPVLVCDETATLALWRFPSGASTTAPAPTSSLVTASAASGAGLTPSISTETNDVGTNSWRSDNIISGPLSTANNEYFEFTINTTGLDSITLDFSSRRTVQGAQNLRLYYGATGTETASTIYSIGSAGTWIAQGPTVLSSGLNPSGNTRFRLYAYNSSVDSSGHYVFVDSVRFRGLYCSEVPPPPPTPGVNPPTIVKSFSPTPIGVGHTSTLTFTVTNPNPATALSGIAFTDELPFGVSVVPGTFAKTCAGFWNTDPGDPGFLLHSGGSLAAAASCTLSVGVTTTTVGSALNVSDPVYSTQSGYNTNPATGIAQAILPVLASPVIAKEFGPSLVLLGVTPGNASTLTFTITNPNASNAIAGVSFSDTFPAGLVVASPPTPTTSGCGSPSWAPTAGAGSVSFSGGAIAAGGTCTVTVRVTGPVGEYENVSSAASHLVNGLPATNGQTAEAALVIDQPIPGVAIRKEAGPGSDPLNDPWSKYLTVEVGGDVFYRITVENTGEVPLTGLTVSDPNVSTAGCVWPNPLPVANALDTHIATCVIGPVAAVAGTRVNTATADANSLAGPVHDDDSATYATVELSLVKSAVPMVYTTAGEEIDYTFTVTNDGDAILPGPVTVTDPLVPGATCPSLTTVGDLDSFFDPGESIACSGAYTILGADVTNGSVTNTAYGSVGGFDTPTDSVTILVPPPTTADLRIAKSDAGSDPAELGGTVTYSIEVTNFGPSDAGNVVVVDTLDPDTTYVSDTGGCVESPPGRLTCALGSMLATGSTSFTVTVNVGVTAPTAGTLSAGSCNGSEDLCNTASVSSDRVDPDLTDNQDSEPTDVTPRADLEIEKSGPAAVVPGESVVYTVTVTNNGPSTAEDVLVVDPTPAGLSFVSNSGDCVSAWPCSLGSIPNGQSRVITSTFSVPASYTLPGPVENTAAVSSSTPDPDHSNDEDTASSSVAPSADIGVSKADSGSPVVQGGRLTYTIEVTNDGPSDATGVAVIDTLDSETTYVSDTGSCVEAPPGTLSCTVGALAAGASTSFTVTVDVSATAPTAATLEAGPCDGSEDICNRVSASADQDDPEPGNDDDSEPTDISPLLSASIGNRVWLDENGDGVQDAGEDGIAGVLVGLYDATGTILLASTVTDMDGRYIFSGVAAAAYVVRVEAASLPAGLAANPTYDFDDGTTSPDGETAITAVADTFLRTGDFGFNWVPVTHSSAPPPGATGAIGDRIWNDANGDGIQNFGEAGIAGVTVRLLVDSNGDGIYGGPGDAAALSTVTGPAGNFVFDDLAPAAYVLEVDTTTLPPGFLTTPTGDPDSDGDNVTRPIVLAPGDVHLNGDFGFPFPAGASIGQGIYLDANGNGTRDPGEPGIPGVTVVLLDGGGNVIASTTTDANGSYVFPGLPDGSYSVVVADPAGVLSGTPTNSGDPDGGNDRRSTVVLAGTDNFVQDFGFAPAGHSPGDGLIGDAIFLDRNASGTFEAGEGIEGVTVRLYDSTGTVLLATAVTNAGGRYVFGGLDSLLAYEIRVDTTTLPGGGVGLVNTVDPDGGLSSRSVVDLTLFPGGTTLEQDFAYEATVPSTIGGTLWNDRNGDGILDAGETARYAGVTVVLRDSNGNVVATTTTDASGNYAFPGLPDGTYSIDVAEDGNALGGLSKSSGPAAGIDGNSQVERYFLTVSGGVTDNSGDFGYFAPGAAIGNRVWSDTDGDGFQDGGEPGLAGVLVTLTITYPNGDVTTVVAVTDAQGAYSFGNLLLDESFDGVGAGEPTYSISVATPGGYTASPIGAGGDPLLDSNDPLGSTALAVQGVTSTTDDSLTSNSQDFGFAPLDCTLDADCDDGLFCNGAETCVANGCVAGTNPCLGGDVCGNVCNEAVDNCLVPSGTVCRAAAGVCDVAEACDGVSTSCPANGFVTAGTQCRASAGVCDVAETCTGSSATCPVDGFVAAATVCRASAGVCDVAEACTGSSAACPVDAFVAASTVCRTSAGVCDVAETCTGSSAACPVDAFVAASTVCRASSGQCDVAENCTGSSASCPAQSFAPASTPCGDPSDTNCDNPDTCDGSGICLANADPGAPMCLSADLAVNKSDAGTGVGRGEQLTYTIDVTNHGPSDATGVTVVDTLGSSMTFVSSTGGCVQAPVGRLTCPVGDMAVGATTSFTVTVLVGPFAPFAGTRESGACNGTEDLCNSVTVSGDQGDPNPSNNSDSEPTDVTTVDLSVEKSDSNTGVNRLQDLVYTIVVANAGPATATGVTVTDTLDPNTTYVTASIGCTLASAGALNCPIGTLAAGASTTFQVTVNVNGSAPISGTREMGGCGSGTDLCNRVYASATQADSNSANNMDEEPTNVMGVNTTTDLAITKTDLTGQVAAGGFATYELTVTNNGPGLARDAIVVDTLDPNMRFVSATANCTESAPGTLVCPLGDLASGTVAVFRVIVHIEPTTPTAGSFSGPGCPGGQDLCNRATVSSLSMDSNASNNMASVSTDAVAATTISELSLTKSDLGAEPVQPGSNVIYEIAVENAGPGDAADVVVHETLDPYMTHVSDTAGCTPVGSTGGGTRLDCPLGTIAAGTSATMQIVVAIAANAPVSSTTQDGDCDDAQDICNLASVTTSSSDFNFLDNQDSEPTDVSASLTCNDGVVDPGETCDPVSGEICNNGIDDDNNGLVDCADTVCRDPGYQSCDGNCQITPVCLPILDDPAFVKWNSISFHGRFIPQTPADPFAEGFRYVLSNENGVIYSAELLPGDMRVRTRKNLSKWTWKDTTARKSRGLRDGIYRLGIHQRLEKSGDISYVMTILAYGDMSAATLATMTTHIYIGDDVAFLTAEWSGQLGGWRLSRKDAILASQN
jgi:uncharacterized repeat protein (TIGR01451 family)